MFAEWAVGGLTRTRLRLLAGRVVAVDAMLHGADFIEVYRTLRRDHGFRRRGAFGICARVFRSGGLAKDAIYLRGFRQVVDLVAAGAVARRPSGWARSRPVMCPRSRNCCSAGWSTPRCSFPNS